MVPTIERPARIATLVVMTTLALGGCDDQPLCGTAEFSAADNDDGDSGGCDDTSTGTGDTGATTGGDDDATGTGTGDDDGSGTGTGTSDGLMLDLV